MRHIYSSLLVVLIFSALSYSSITIVDYASNLQTAIDNAADGDVIKVKNGGSSINIVIQLKSNITIESYDPTSPITLTQSYIYVYSSQNISIKNINFLLNDNICGIMIWKSEYTKIDGCTLWGQYTVNNNYGIENIGQYTTVTNCTIGGYLAYGMYCPQAGDDGFKIFYSDISGQGALYNYYITTNMICENSSFTASQTAIYTCYNVITNLKSNIIQGGSYDVYATWGKVYSSWNTFSSPSKIYAYSYVELN